MLMYLSDNVEGGETYFPEVVHVKFRHFYVVHKFFNIDSVDIENEH